MHDRARDRRAELTAPLTVPGPPASAAAVRGPLRNAFQALDDRGIAWALLRGVEALGDRSADVDVLVDAAAMAEIDAVLRAAGFARIPASGHGSHRFYVSYDPSEDRWIDLDVVTDVAFGTRQEFRTALAPALLGRRRRVGAVAALHPEDRFWHLLLHLLLSHGEVPVRYRDALCSCASSAFGAGPLEACVRALRPGVASRLPAAVNAGDWRAVVELGRELQCAWYLREGFGVVARSTLHCLERHAPSGRTRRGMSVAVLGPDGAGKTTLAKALGSSTPLPATYLYLGVWRESRFEAQLRRVFGARLALRLARLMTKAVLIAWNQRRGRLVVLDRYTLDADLPSDDLDLKGRISARLVRRTNADPDLMILLDAPAELMYARKGEHGVAELRLRRNAYLAMAKRFPQMVVVDAEQSRDEVRRQATQLIWKRWLQSDGSGASRPASRPADVRPRQ
jgi:thymidylate kinase